MRFRFEIGSGCLSLYPPPPSRFQNHPSSPISCFISTPPSLFPLSLSPPSTPSHNPSPPASFDTFFVRRQVWAADEGALLHTIQASSKIHSLDWNPDGTLLAVATEESDVLLRRL